MVHWCRIGSTRQYNSHKGEVLIMGKGAIVSSTIKQKIHLWSSIESQLISMDDKIFKVLWIKCFLVWQGFLVKLNIIYQDNTRSINLEENRKEIFGKTNNTFWHKMFLHDFLGWLKRSKDWILMNRLNYCGLYNKRASWRNFEVVTQSDYEY